MSPLILPSVRPSPFCLRKEQGTYYHFYGICRLVPLTVYPLRTHRYPNIAETLIYALEFQTEFRKQITLQYTQPLPDTVIGNGPASVREQFFQTAQHLLLHDTDGLSADRLHKGIAGIDQGSDIDRLSFAAERRTAETAPPPPALPEHEQKQETGSTYAHDPKDPRQKSPEGGKSADKKEQRSSHAK